MSLFLSIASTDDELCLIQVGNTFIFDDDDDDDDDVDNVATADAVKDDWIIAADCNAAMTSTDSWDA